MQRRQMQTSSNGTSALSPRKRFAAAFRHSATPPRDTGNEIFVESYPPGSHLFHRYPGGSTRQTAAPGSGSSVNTTWKIFLLTAAAVFPELLTHTHTHKWMLLFRARKSSGRLRSTALFYLFPSFCFSTMEKKPCVELWPTVDGPRFVSLGCRPQRPSTEGLLTRIPPARDP